MTSEKLGTTLSADALRVTALAVETFARIDKTMGTHSLKSSKSAEECQFSEWAKAKKVDPILVQRAIECELADQDKRILQHSASVKRIPTLVRFTRTLPLEPYESRLSTVPKVVNVVACMSTSSTDNFPLNLRRISALLAGSFFAPRRFASVQVGIQNLMHSNRTRVLIFRSGQIVLTGSKSVAASRLAGLLILKRLRQIGVHLSVSTFSVVNMVGSSDIGGRVDVERFAADNTSTTTFDRRSFVGLTLRLPLEITVELYATGKANIPGSCDFKRLLLDFADALNVIDRYRL